MAPDGTALFAIDNTNGSDLGNKLVRLSGDQPLPTANQQFVAQVFLDLLGRGVDDGGQSAFSGMLDQGVARGTVVLIIEASNEYTSDVVRQLYATYLHRGADDEEVAIWSSFLRGGSSVESVALQFIDSAEFRTTQGQSTNDGFLNALYQDVFSRSVDTGGRQFWDQFLNGGGTTAQIASAVLSSQEYHDDVVKFGFLTLLRRLVDDAGLSAFSNALAAGLADALFNAQVIASDEYFQRISQ
jgi:hypothetical protein